MNQRMTLSRSLDQGQSPLKRLHADVARRRPATPDIRALGNLRVQRLTVGPADDPAELEAERVAESVTGGGACCQREAEGGPGAVIGGSAAPAIVDQVVGQSGQPLPDEVRAPMERALGRDFTEVRLHDGRQAAQAAAAISARAFTVESNIVLGARAPDLSSAEGRHLLAHELAHVMQLGGARRVTRQIEDPPSAGEEVPQLPTVSGEGQEREVQAMANVSLPGRTDARFSSSFSTTNQRTRADPPGCQIVSGTLVSTFRVTTTVTLPSVPEGLTPCQAGNARRFIDTILNPHEQQHVAAFNTYNGTTSRPFSVTVCAGESLSSLVQAEHDSDDGARQAGAQALSDALDPFNVDVDIDAGCTP